MNASVHSTTTYPAFELLYGRKAAHFLSAPDVTGGIHDYAKNHQQMHKDAWDAVQLATARTKTQHVTTDATPIHPTSQKATWNDSSDDSNSRERISLNVPPHRLHPTKDAIKFRALDAIVIWQDSEGQEQRAEPVSLDVDFDNDENTAYFRLHTNIRLRTRRRALYLCIPPETVLSITYKNEENIRSLDFSLTQKPEFIIPPEPLESRKTTKNLVEKFTALSSMTQFTVKLQEHKPTQPDGLSVIRSADLKKIASIFRPRPKTDRKRANIQGLYAGKPGRIFDASTTATSGSLEAEIPPPYHLPKSSQSRKKRKRGDSNVDDNELSKNHDATLLEKRLERIECSLSTVVEMVGILIRSTQDNDDRYRQLESEEKEVLFQDVRDQVNNTLDERVDDLLVECEGKVRECEHELDQILDEKRDKVKEAYEKQLKRLDEIASDHQDQVIANTREMIAESVNEQIQAETLAMGGAKHLDIITESVNEGWNNSIPLIGAQPQPDFSLGFNR
ncbi:uncharacterized protein TRIVIDRAFT_221682 [Trichoderma virens Gv29-8]|uniref:DUF7924 domain-containing protein n=1 Tax=Hypocrea virens (strain Gv29-8 / FGSC 10586) TaxID=413071 RepID=G9MTQ3_HYPVG|nr:uncharacterized protein TRIVIDRAFT_221682 [Trichoderma virens Gv29-8]EHK22403.1 hypothetical protein TRIVIDRAFT_221682 [Trichoderma virens Gv29-8]UKZ47444.1 hypothetical protein TrVGV298_001662 [Trichoderma virens]